MGFISTPGKRANGRQADYKAYFDDRLRRGRWVPVLLDWLAVMSPSEAVLIGVVLNAGRMQPGKDWVLATPAFVEGQCGFSFERQTKLLAQLERKLFVSVKSRGTNRQHVLVRIDEIEKAAREASK